MELEQILFSQGFGTRRQCRMLIAQGAVGIGGTVREDPAAAFDVDAAPFEFEVNGERWVFHTRAYVMLHKPAGYECSQKPKSHPSVYRLLPAPLRERGKGGVQAVGRLDQDATGLLLFSDNGQFIHRMASLKHHVPKVYEVTASESVSPLQMERLLAGVVLEDDPEPVKALACAATGPCQISLTLASGKYHQVKRMLAAVGNHVEQLHRSRIGGLALPPDLKAGEWRWLSGEQLAAVAGSASRR
ncbi:MAG: 16S rRNA pseudouridine(516) synthase [Betaproteobacteria bacterium]|nr:16S rRNA pseudouridine(516) synthase [Betaproteobacteria bacterium]